MAAQYLAQAQVFAAQAQQIAAQASVAATQIAANVATTVEAMNLPQYLAPLYPVVDSLALKAAPLFAKATNVVLPHISPYLDLAAPYITGAKPHLDKVGQAELLLIVGGIFGGAFLLQLVLALTATCRRNGSPLRAFTPTVFWLLFCAIIHSWIEYSFVFRREGNVSGFQNGMDLYGAADYRYGFGKTLQLEAGTAAMEAITAFITGPLCLVLAWGIVGQKAWRWSVQLVLCACQMYGLAWFMAHPFFSADRISSEDPFLYWVIFVGFNAPWGIVPPLMMLSAMLHVNGAVNYQQVHVEKAARALKQLKAVNATVLAQQQQQQRSAAAAASPEKKKGGK